MTLHTHWSLTLDAVADTAASVLRTPPPGDDPFVPDVLVVGGRGVEQWLRLALVTRLDILTNVQVWSPSRFVSDLQRWAVPASTGGSAALTLAILSAVEANASLLPTELQHLASTPGVPATPLLVAWAARAAGTFERYALHRIEWLARWEQGTDHGSGDWQARLWRAAVARLGGAPAEVHARTVEALRTGRPSGLTARWMLLHQGRMPRAQLALVEALAVHHEVHVLVHAPTSPLQELALTRGSLAADTLRETLLARQHVVASRLDRVRTDSLALFAHTLGATGTQALVRDGALPDGTGAPHSVLSAVQHRLRTDVASDPAPWPVQDVSVDRSLRVLACHGALRQVEVLKDALLRAFDHDHTLQPRDVVILTPDPARFVPLLQAIFPLTHARDATKNSVGDRDVRSSEATPPLVLHVQGRSPRATNPVADVIIRLLSLADERASASRVLDLVERGPVADAFGLTPADAPVIRAWMHEAGVRWGIDATDPQREGLGLHEEGTWRRGLRRVLLGVAMHDEPRGLDRPDVHLAGHAPVAGLEGERAALAGRAARAVRLVLDTLDAARIPRTLHEWAAWTDTALHTLLPHTGAAAIGAARLREIMAALASDAAAVRVRGTLAAAAVAQLLEHRMEDLLVAPGRLGGITVAPLVAGWVRPARVVALVGMDDELFPRRGGAPWFDKLAESPMLGDPDDRGEQLQTVFDALMMAREQLLITYTGWNKAGTMRLPPSVAVGAIADAVHDAVRLPVPEAVRLPVPEADRDTVWRTLVERDMPLQPFSARAFVASVASSDPAREHANDGVSFDTMSAATASRLWRSGAGHAPTAAREVISHDPERRRARRDSRTTLPLATLLRFLRGPAAEILSRLGVWQESETLMLDDVLPITLDRGVESRAVVQMAEAQLLGGDVERTLQALQHGDQVPPARLGEVWAHAARQRAAWLVSSARDAIGDTPRSAPEVLRVQVGNTLVTGTIDNRHGDTLLFLRDGKHRPERLLGALVTLCFAASAGGSARRAHQVDADRGTTLTLPSDPLALLADCVQLYFDADRTVPPYAPRTSFTYVAAAMGGDEQAAIDKADDAWAPENSEQPAERDEPGNALLHQVPPTRDPQFATIATRLFRPVFSAMGGA